LTTGAGQKPLSKPPYIQRMMNQLLIEQVKLLVARLERLSADSLWAHRSSGARGELLRWLARLEAAGSSDALNHEERARLEAVIRHGYWLLERAARELL